MGLMLAEPDFHTRCFVEWEDYPRRAIIAAQRAGYFAPAPIWTDLTTFDGRPWRGIIDTVLAGYPCQPFSAAGQRRGADDERHLWPDVARVIREVEPLWVFLENVAGHVSLGAETVLRELWDMGWTPAAGIFSAAEVGASHERQRWFCVAYRDSQHGRADGRQPDAAAGRAGEPMPHMADASGARTTARGPEPQRRKQGQSDQPIHDCRPLFPPGPGDRAAWADALATAPDMAPATSLGDCFAWASDLATAGEGPGQAAAQSRLCGMADGLAARARALRLLGNGVCPLSAAYAWRTLASAHGLGAVDLEAADRHDATGTDGV